MTGTGERADPDRSADGPTEPERRVPRAPTLLDALAPIVVLIGLLATTIVLFGIDATNGPLQVALFLSAAFASLIAFKNGYTAASVADAAVGGVSSALGRSSSCSPSARSSVPGTWPAPSRRSSTTASAC